MKIDRKILLLGLGSFLAFTGFWVFISWEVFPGYLELRSVLLNKLSKAEPLSTADESQLNAGDVIYVLGGSVQSLQYRFETASKLYQNRVAKKILIDSDQTMMEFDSSIGRNLTFNEWAIGNLVALGVSKEDIEPVVLEKGFFGTYQEAKGISHLVSKRGYRALVLVTSSYHTQRTWRSFSKFRNRNVDLYIYRANDGPSVPTLVKEYLKLEVYKILLL